MTKDSESKKSLKLPKANLSHLKNYNDNRLKISQQQV